MSVPQAHDDELFLILTEVFLFAVHINMYLITRFISLHLSNICYSIGSIINCE
jgi:hypothetical protein